MSEDSNLQPRRSWRGILAILAILGITGATFGADLVVGEAEQEPPRRLVIDASYPAVSPSAEPVGVTIGKGRQAVVRVFAASCGSCFGELDALSAIAQEHDTDLVAVAVGTASPDEAPPTVRGEATIADQNGEIARRLGVEEPPMTLIVDGKGNVVGRRRSIATAELGDLLDRARSRTTERADR